MTLSGSLDALGTLFTWSLTFDKLKQNLKQSPFDIYQNSYAAKFF